MEKFGLSFYLINAVIILGGFVVLFALNTAHGRIRKNKEEARKLYNTVKGKPIVDISNGMMSTLEETAYGPEKMDAVREKYNENSTAYFAWTQTISIFPRAGLLGTVIGIIPGLGAINQGAEGMDILYSSLSTALYSTLFGLIWSIILKAVVAYQSHTISDIEDYFEEDDRKYNMALNLKRVKEDQT